MTDYSELKRLAEALNGVKTVSSLADCEAFNGFYRFVNPAVVLGLIAKLERAESRLCVCRDCVGQGEVYSGHDSYQGHFQPPEPDMDVCGTCGGDGVLGPLEDFETLAAERDQLKAECEGLRKDAERYQWLRNGISQGKVDICIVRCDWTNSSKRILEEDSADFAVDSAMSKESGQ